MEFTEDSGARRRLLMMQVALDAAANAASNGGGNSKSNGDNSDGSVTRSPVEATERVRGGQRRLLGTATVTFIVMAQLDVLGYASADTFEAALNADLETTIEDGTFTASYAVKG